MVVSLGVGDNSSMQAFMVAIEQVLGKKHWDWASFLPVKDPTYHQLVGGRKEANRWLMINR